MEIIAFNPHPKQAEIIDSILLNDAKFHTIIIGRQWGKTLMAINLILYWAFNDSPCDLLWVSPVYSQAQKVQKEINNILNNTGLIKSNNYTDNILTLVNDSKIIFRSGERYDNIRGFTFDYAVIDECAYLKEEAWSASIRPTLAVKGKKVIFISTPKGKNWIHKLYELGKSNNSNYLSYNAPSSSSPYIPLDELEDAKKTLPSKIYEQEYLAQFIEDGGEVFSNINEIMFDQWPTTPSTKFYAGLDLAKQEDFTCLTIFNDRGEVVEIYHKTQTDWNQLIDELAKVINKYNAITLIEVNSMGDVIYDQLKRKVKQISPFVTSNKSKQEIIEGLILSINNKEISIPSERLFKPLKQELEVFTYEYSPKTRNVKYGAPNGFHDDCVMSLALATYALKTQKTKGQYTILT